MTGEQFFNCRVGVQNGDDDHLRVSTPDILDCNMYRRFWLSWDDNTVKVGRGWNLKTDIFYTREDDGSISTLRYLSYGSWDRIKGHYVFVH